MSMWSIEYWQLPIALAGVHGQLLVRDSAGAIVRSYEGLATGRNGRIKPIGYLPSDRIRCYVCDGGPATTLTERRYPRQTLHRGEETEMRARIASADEVVAAINRLDLAYPLLGVLGIQSNSNAVISTLVDAMGVNKPQPGGYAPGHGRLLLPQAMLLAARRHWTPQGSADQNCSVSTSLLPCGA